MGPSALRRSTSSARFADCAKRPRAAGAAVLRAGVKGTLLLAPEGINGTIAGSDAAIERVLDHIRAPASAAPTWRSSSPAPQTHAVPSHEGADQARDRDDGRAAISIRCHGAGHYVAPADWNALIGEPGTIVIDARNDYEVAVGTFAGAIDPQTRTFRDFPAGSAPSATACWAAARRRRSRCSAPAASAARSRPPSSRREGIDEVYHLQGGILKYLEEVPREQSLWQGECFVFDERVTVGHGLAPGSYALCRACRRPVSAQDRASPLYEAGVSCPACHGKRSDEQRAGYRERHRQECLAAARGESHVGVTRDG